MYNMNMKVVVDQYKYAVQVLQILKDLTGV